MEELQKYIDLSETSHYDEFLTKLFDGDNLEILNIFLKTEAIIHVFMAFSGTYDSRIEELDKWILNEPKISLNKDLMKQIRIIFNNYAFEQGKYNLLHLEELEKNKLNQVLIFNKKPSLDPIFNKFLNQYKNTDIKLLKLNELINKRYFNYRYNSLPSFCVNENDVNIKEYEPINGTNISQKIKLEAEKIGESFYMTNKGFSRNPLFKRYSGLLYLYLKTNLDIFKSYDDILNVVLSFEFLQYSRTIFKNDLINKDNAGLITFITFKCKNGQGKDFEKLNYRYQQSIEWLRNPSQNRLTYTKINDDEKGLYITTNHEPKGYNELLEAFKNKEYEKNAISCF